MRPTMLLLLLSWLIVAIATESQAQTIVCQGSTIPEGFVIIAAGRSTTCPGASPETLNTYTIKKPAVVEIVCLGSPIPAGYVVERTGSSSRCPGWRPDAENTQTIRRP